MARKRTGTLVWTKQGFAARLTVDVDGEAVKKWFLLGTDNKQAARRKMARRIAELAAGKISAGNLPKELARAESVAEACTRIHQQRLQDGVKDAKDALGRFEHFVKEQIGQVEVTKVKPTHINDALDFLQVGGQVQADHQAPSPRPRQRVQRHPA